jgi:hypothetical protein
MWVCAGYYDHCSSIDKILPCEDSGLKALNWRVTRACEARVFIQSDEARAASVNLVDSAVIATKASSFSDVGACQILGCLNKKHEQNYYCIFVSRAYDKTKNQVLRCSGSRLVDQLTNYC